MTASAAPPDLRGRLVLVTGGVRGFGGAISRAFAARGAHVIVNYFHSRQEAPAFLAELLAAGGSAELAQASVASREQVAAMFAAVAARHGGLDVLVNNAGTGALGPVDGIDDRYWERAWEIDLRGSRWCAQHAAPLLAARGGGAIVNISSLGGGSLVLHNFSACGTAKAAVEALTRYLAVEYAPQRIRANTVTVGVMESPVVHLFPESERLLARVREATPLEHRLGRQEEAAAAVVFLASPAASWITGQNLVVDGGLSLGALLLSPAPAPVVEAAPAAPAATLAAAPAPDADAVIAIVGMGAVAPGANSVEELWQLLHGERHAFGRPARFEAEAFYSPDPAAEDRSYTRESGFITDFRPHPRLRAELDAGALPSLESTTLWLRHCLHAALEATGRRGPDRVFAAFGYTADGSQDLEERLVLAGYRARLAEQPGGDAAELAARLQRRYDRLGTSSYEYLPHRVGRHAIAGILPAETELVMVDSACSSSLYSVDLAVKALREGACDLAVCGGAFAYTARNVVLFSKLSGLSRTGEVRSFDRDASGVLFSDGAGVLALKRLDRARADGDRVLGVIEGIGLSCDGRGKAIYAPNEAGQVLALRRAYADGGLDPATVGWVIAHATGTQAGDSTELAALNQVAGQGPPALLSSNKAIVGHAGWAAGTLSIVQAVLGLARGTVPAQRYFRHPNPALGGSRFAPPTAPTALDGSRPRRAAVSAFGFGGTNAHLVLSEDASAAARAPRPALATGEVVVVGWAVDLPGDPDPARVAAWLRGEGRAPDVVFGDEYPLPGFREVPVPPATLRNMDRAQIMLLRAAARFAPELREACARRRDTVGVIAACLGPTRRAVHYALRCYLGDLARCLEPAGPEAAGLLGELEARVKALVPPSTEDSFPGIMPNVIAARLAALSDFHGLNLTIDTGPDAALDALRTAERALRHHNLDLAVVAGVNGNSTPELASVVAEGGEQRALAEGAFLLALAREETARAEGLPVLARLRTGLGASEVPTRPRALAALAERTYLGADGMVALLARLAQGRSAARVGSAAAWGVQLEVDVAASLSDDGDEPARPPSVVERYLPVLAPTVAEEVRPALPAFPTGTLVLAADGGLAARLRLRANTSVVVAPAAAVEDAAALLPAGEIRHVRVIATVGAAATAPEDLSAVDRLRPLHDLAYAAAARWSAGPEGSFLVALLDAVRAGVPHPAAGPFIGLVKSLAREQPEATSLTLLLDDVDAGADAGLDRAVSLLAAESGRRQQLAVVVHAGGSRQAYALKPASLPRARNPPLARGSVVVATGGARGITAELLLALARAVETPPTLYLLGRGRPADESALPPRREFLEAERVRRPGAALAELNTTYDRRRAEAEVRRNLERLAAVCGEEKVHYLACDVRDHDAVFAAVARIHAAHDRVDLLVNAAGLHAGGSVRATPLPRARLVRDTKLLGYLNLRQAFAARPPRRWCNVGSLLAVLGWPGEASYCAGNELLNVAAAWSRRFGHGDETTLAMALWDEAGFAAEPVTRDLLRKQGALTGVSNDVGAALFLAELAAGDGAPTVTYLGRAEQELLGLGPPLAGAEGEHRYTPDVAGRDGCLRQHRIQGAPVLPGAWILELAAEAAATSLPPGVPLLARGLRFHAPARTEPPPTDGYRLRTAPGEGGWLQVGLYSDVTAPDGRVLRRDRLHAELALQAAASPPAARAPIPPARGRALTPPWYEEGAPLRLEGPFRSLTSVTVERAAARAVFAPQLGGWAHRFAAMRLPVLLLDALIQLAVIARGSGAGPITDMIPEAVDQVSLFTTRTDVDLLAEHGPAIVLTADGEGAAAAFAPDGAVLARVQGVRAAGRARQAQEARLVTREAP